jgi:CBS domain-containing protein
MDVGEVMSINFTRMRSGSSMAEAAELAAVSHASDLMVVDEDNTFVGVLSEGDLIRTIMPRFEEVMQSSESMTSAFEMFVDEGAASAGKPIDGLVIRDPITLSPSDNALKAASTMVSKQIRCLPVVDGDKLVGVISRADVCRSVLRGTPDA